MIPDWMFIEELSARDSALHGVIIGAPGPGLASYPFGELVFRGATGETITVRGAPVVDVRFSDGRWFVNGNEMTDFPSDAEVAARMAQNRTSLRVDMAPPGDSAMRFLADGRAIHSRCAEAVVRFNAEVLAELPDFRSNEGHNAWQSRERMEEMSRLLRDPGLLKMGDEPSPVELAARRAPVAAGLWLPSCLELDGAVLPCVVRTVKPVGRRTFACSILFMCEPPTLSAGASLTRVVHWNEGVQRRELSLCLGVIVE